MKNANQTDPIQRFWARYIHFLSQKNIKPAIARWYVIRTEHYINAFPDKRLAAHCPEDVNAYLKKQAENSRIADWQFRQIVDAIQKLWEMLGVGWFKNVDWEHWLHSASLTDTHPTVADQVSAEETIKKLGKNEVVSYLQHLAVGRGVAASTQNQALNALVFFYEHALKQPLGNLGEFIRAKRPKKLPVVLTPGEVQQLLGYMNGRHRMMASLLYGPGFFQMTVKGGTGDGVSELLLKKPVDGNIRPVWLLFFYGNGRFDDLFGYTFEK